MRRTKRPRPDTRRCECDFGAPRGMKLQIGALPGGAQFEVSSWKLVRPQACAQGNRVGRGSRLGRGLRTSRVRCRQVMDTGCLGAFLGPIGLVGTPRRTRAPHLKRFLCLPPKAYCLTRIDFFCDFLRLFAAEPPKCLGAVKPLLHHQRRSVQISGLGACGEKFGSRVLEVGKRRPSAQGRLVHEPSASSNSVPVWLKLLLVVLVATGLALKTIQSQRTLRGLMMIYSRQQEIDRRHK